MNPWFIYVYFLFLFEIKSCTIMACKTNFKTLFGVFLTLLLAASVSAQEQGIDSGDTAWVMISSALVLLMVPGVGFFYCGMVRKKNVLSILTQSFVIIAVVTLQWVLIGYSLSFGPDIGGVIGDLSWAGLKGVGMNPSPDYATTIPHLTFMVFQGMFAIITPALIIGAFTDRMKFSTLISFTLLWTTLIYDPLVHWVWGTGGWLAGMGVLDFAGGIVVHVSAGISALVAAILIGKRIGLNGTLMLPHNITLTVLGAAMLWFGWFGFNAGSALGANGLAAHAFVVTNIAGAAGALSWMLVSWIHMKKSSTLGVVTGAVAGLATITPAAGFVSPLAAIVIGFFTGAVCYAAVVFIKTKTGIDDALDVMACHGVGGIIGMLFVGVFASTAINPAGADGLLAGNLTLMLTQLTAVVVTLLYAGVGTFVILKVLDAVMGIRVTKEEEIIGLDLVHHGEEAYLGIDIPG